MHILLHLKEMKIKVLKKWIQTDWKIKIKIEILLSLFLRDCWSGVIKFLFSGFSI
jgi:Txe/YoeB family toxin of Txe-Axe toxin-antitoxin module